MFVRLCFCSSFYCVCLVIPFTESSVDVHGVLLLSLFRICPFCSARATSTIFIECFPSFGAEMQAVPSPLLPHCFLLFFSFIFLEHIQGSDKGFNGILRAPLFHLLTHGCMLRHPFYLVNFSTSHFTVLSVSCSVSIFARETCVWLSKWLYCAISIWMMCFGRDLHEKSNRAERPVSPPFCYDRVPVCISQSVLSTLPGVISVNRC